MGWAQFDRRAHVAGGLGAIRAVCRAWQAFLIVLALGTLEANPGFPQHLRGLGFCIPYPRIRTQNLDANRVFLVHVSYFCRT